MWHHVYNKKGKPVKRSWTAFAKELKREHQPIIKVEMLNANLRPVGKKLTSPGVQRDMKGAFTNLVSDGSVDIDVERGIRRTAELTILNPTAEFTPATGNFDPEGPWVGEIYLNRIVRIWRGVIAGRVELYVPVGTFMIDAAEVIVEQNMCLVNLTMSDMWKKISKSAIGTTKRYDEGTLYNTIIQDLIQGTGIKLTGRYGAVLDSLKDRAVDERKITHKLKIDRGDMRGDVIKELTKKWGIDAYIDPLGTFRTEDRRDEANKRIVWRFVSREVGEDGRNGGLVSITRAFNDDRIYNHVIVVGTGKKKRVVKARMKDTRPQSKTSIAKIGDRVLLRESQRVSNVREARQLLRRLWRKRFAISDTLTCDVICNPALEGDDVVKVVEPDKAKIRGRYRLKRLNVPLVTSRQTVEVSHIIRQDDITVAEHEEGGGG